MGNITYLSIKAAANSGEPVGSVWTVRLGEYEEYTGLIYPLGYQSYAVETSRGRLTFNADEVLSLRLAEVDSDWTLKLPITNEIPYL